MSWKFFDKPERVSKMVDSNWKRLNIILNENVNYLLIMPAILGEPFGRADNKVE